ncbi:MAG: NAD-dependent epimerase/dehydratase family protein [Coxiellaceae bacterium]|nr:NAD-dependent epimerase/dehydratase family protein [Coxiellaceae bacterium]
MKRLLFIGGTAFFGKLALKKLIDSGKYNITVVTRGNVFPEEFQGCVRFIICNRSEKEALALALKEEQFDIIVDNIARTALDVTNILDIFRGKIEHYLLCSSGGVYPEYCPHEWVENEAVLVPIPGRRPYDNNKREAESVLMTYRDVSYTIYRPTVVEGPDDSMKRTLYFVRKINQQEQFNIPEGVIFKHVYSDDLASAIVELIALHPMNRAYNICGDDKVTLDEYCHMIAGILGKKPCHQVVSTEKFSNSDHADFPSSYDRTLILSNELLKKTIHYHPTAIQAWLPVTVRSDFENMLDRVAPSPISRL